MDSALRDDSAEGHWIDVTVPLRNGMVHWPGDPEVEVRRALSMTAGDGVNVTRVACSAHVGTHLDAPLHFIDGAASIDRMPLEVGIGPARVLEIEAGGAIEIGDLEPHAISAGERILLRTRNSRQAWRSGRSTRTSSPSRRRRRAGSRREACACWASTTSPFRACMTTQPPCTSRSWRPASGCSKGWTSLPRRSVTST